MTNNDEISSDARWIIERSLETTKEFTKIALVFPSAIGILSQHLGILSLNLSCWWIFVIAIIFLTLSWALNMRQLENLANKKGSTQVSKWTNRLEYISALFIILGYIVLIFTNLLDITLKINGVNLL